MKNSNDYFDAKKALYEEFGESYPTKKTELTYRFLARFAAFVDGPNVDDFENYSEYDEAKYRSERWHFMEMLADGIIRAESDAEAWNAFLDWVVENYFPEFASISNEKY